MGYPDRINLSASEYPYMDQDINIWIEKPKDLDDMDLMDVADYLREERLALAQRLIRAGRLDEEWLHDRYKK